LLPLIFLPVAPLPAQDWTSGLSPWTGLGTLNPQSALSPWSGLGTLTPQSPLSPWSGLGALTPQSPLSPWSGPGTLSPQSPLSPWSSLANPMTQSTLPYGPSSGLTELYAPYRQQLFNAWQAPTYAGRPLTCPDATVTDSYQPNLTGIWRGSGGETVEIERNRARIWGGQDKPCNCVFFLVGQRLIAYSPDTDTVRKYWYRGTGNQFMLIDESGNLLTFQRSR